MKQQLNLDNGTQAQTDDLPKAKGEIDTAKHRIPIEIDGKIVRVEGDSIQAIVNKAVDIRMAGMNAQVRSTIPVPPLREYLAQFQATYKSMLRGNTKAAYAHLIRNHILPALGNKTLDRITTADIQSLYDDMAKADLSLETIKKVRNILRPCFASAVEDGLIDRNPIDSKRLVIHTSKGSHHKAIPEDMMFAIRSSLHTLPDNDRRFMGLLCYSGMRKGEILALRWEDLDFERGLIHVCSGVTHPDRNQPVVGLPKTKSSVRTIPMPSSLQTALQPIETQGFVIGGESPLTYQQDRLLWQRLKNRYQLDGYSRHDFRDTCTTEWVEADISLYVASSMLGHENVSTTAKYYAKVRQKSLDDAKRKMEGKCQQNCHDTSTVNA